YRYEDFDFADLILSLHEIPGLRRIRYTSPHPTDINAKVMDLYGFLPKLCPNLHLPLQAGSNSVLQRMRRDYTREEYLQKVDYLRKKRPDIAISSDIIIGFPGESEEDFCNTMDVVRQVEYSSIFSFKYSRRKYTAALKVEDDVPEEVKSERLSRLQELQRQIQTRLNQRLVGSVQEVLAETHSRRDGQELSGRTPCNRVVNFAGAEEALGAFHQVRINAAGPNSLAGSLL
ncbi:MAG TPA: MiaB/RimO family radical SAM methylthiotransferase, partial [Acidobacteriota bacterium]|nr:MiaB/RimO family radical SAM methylthiotransferase [Acidobacteriota bacterium]